MFNLQPRSASVVGCVIALGAVGLSMLAAPAAADKPPPPVVVVLLPTSDHPASTVQADILQLRDGLRQNPRIELLAFDPSAPTFEVAAQQAGVDLNRLNGETDRIKLARALGAQLIVTVSLGRETDSAGNPTVSVLVRALSPSGSLGPGVSADNDSVTEAGQLIVEQALVIGAAQSIPMSSPASPVAQAVPLPAAVATPAPARPAEPSPSAPTPETDAPPSVPAAPVSAAPTASPSTLPEPTVSSPASRTSPLADNVPAPDAPIVTSPPVSRTISDQAQQLIDDGDGAMQQLDTGRAIDDYRKAVDAAPLSSLPRIKLARAYMSAGDPDLALDELRRAVKIDPGSKALQDYLTNLSSQDQLPGVDTILLQVQADANPNDPKLLVQLGDAYWNSDRLDLAEQSYRAAAQIAGAGSTPFARLARLYAATHRYDLCLQALAQSGNDGYPAALRIVEENAESLIGMIDADKESFQTGAEDRTAFYAALKTADAQAAAYSAFISKIQPPAEYKVSYLHRQLAAKLLAQVTPELENYALTGEASSLDQSNELERDAEHELDDANLADKLQQTVSAGR